MRKQLSLFIVGVLAVLAGQPAVAQVINNIPRLSEIERPATSLKE